MLQIMTVLTGVGRLLSTILIPYVLSSNAEYCIAFDIFFDVAAILLYFIQLYAYVNKSYFWSVGLTLCHVAILLFVINDGWTMCVLILCTLVHSLLAAFVEC